jgi:hypothetical protein
MRWVTSMQNVKKSVSNHDYKVKNKTSTLLPQVILFIVQSHTHIGPLLN